MDAPIDQLGPNALVAVGTVTSSGRKPGNAGAHWSKVANRRWWLSEAAEIVRQHHRGLLWYVVRDRLGDRYYRFSPNVYMFISLLDGSNTIEEVYQLVVSRLGDDAPSELEVLQLLWRLHAADLLKGDVAGRTEDIVARAESMDRQRWIMQLRSPLAVRIALLDPSRLLDAMAVFARAMFSVPAFIIWLMVVFAGLSQVALNFTSLATDWLFNDGNAAVTKWE